MGDRAAALEIVGKHAGDLPAGAEHAGEPDSCDQLDDRQAAAIAARYAPLDWDAVFAADDLAPDWLVPEVLERGRSHAIFSPAKAGKSLLTLDMVAAVATGRALLGRPGRDPVTVLYVDLENSRTDLHRRLSGMGYAPDQLKPRLIYLSFPDLPPLDSPEGGRHLAALVRHHGAGLVVLDTVSRVVDGPENDSDTWRAMYRNSLVRLKAAEVTVLRLDHAGKDPAKGQRGSSAKADDLDTVWYLYGRGHGRFTLRLDRQRSGAHPDAVELVRHAQPLRHVVVDSPTAECSDPAIAGLVGHLDRLAVPRDAGRDRARRALVDAGIPASNADISAAVAVRKARPPLADNGLDDELDAPLWDAS